HTRKMIFTLAEQISHLSTRVTLQPGDLILTGTPAGVGLARKEFLKAGDGVKGWVEGIRPLTNTCAELHRPSMAKRKPSKRGAASGAKGTNKPAEPAATPDEQISYSGLSLHELFEQQTREMLDRSDLDEEQKQNILVAMSCPCCGAGAMSYTVKLKR